MIFFTYENVGGTCQERYGQKQRKPFHIYLDEAHRFVTDSLEDIIAETRKYNVSMTLAHQYFKQFDHKKVDALNSVGTTKRQGGSMSSRVTARNIVRKDYLGGLLNSYQRAA